MYSFFRVLEIFANITVRSGLSHHAFIQGIMEYFQCKDNALEWRKHFLAADLNYTVAKMNCERLDSNVLIIFIIG